MKKTGIFGYIYMIVNLVDGRKYVGQTCRKPKYRWSQHLRFAEKGHLGKLYVAMRYHGKQNFELRVLQENVPVEILDYTEIFYIAKYEAQTRGYNILEGGISGYKMRFSDSHIENLREANQAKPKDPEKIKAQIARMNKVRLEKGFSDEYRLNCSIRMTGNQYNKGRKFGPPSEETRKKIGASRKGVPKTEAVKQAMRDGWAKRKARIVPIFLVN